MTKMPENSKIDTRPFKERKTLSKQISLFVPLFSISISRFFFFKRLELKRYKESAPNFQIKFL